MNGPVPGGRFAGYEVLTLLGKGGMGSVYGVRNTDLDRREALKVLSVDAGGDFAARFAAEARTVASLDHPGIVTVYHHGITDGIGWFTMQYLEGDDLTGAGRLPLPDVIAIVTQVAEALDYAHARGVLHRDIKPANIQVRRDAAGAVDRVTVLDFGIARLAGATSLTAADSFIGTLAYSAPESIHGRRDVPAADQYALACTAYELLAGRPPLSADSPAALINAQLHRAAPPLSTFAPGLGALDPVFARALAKDPAHRFGSCRAFATALAAPIAPPPMPRAPVAPPPAPAPAPMRAVTGPRPTATGPAGSSSNTTTVLSLITIIVGLIVIVVAVALATL